MHLFLEALDTLAFSVYVGLGKRSLSIVVWSNDMDGRAYTPNPLGRAIILGPPGREYVLSLEV